MSATPGKNRPPHPLIAGVLEFLQIGGLFYVLLLLPLIFTWLTSGTVTTPWQATFTGAAEGWLFLHHVRINIDDAGFGLTPWGLTLIPIFMGIRAGRRLTDQLWISPRDEDGGEEQGRASRRLRDIHRAFLAGAVSYIALSLIVAIVGYAQNVQPVLWQTVVSPVVIVGASVVAGAHHRAVQLRKKLDVGMELPLPAGFLVDFVIAQVKRLLMLSEAASTWIPVVCQAALIGFLAIFGAGALLVAVSIVFHWADISAVYERLSPGVAGGSVLTVVQLGWLPNLAVFAAAWVSGAGFEIGTGNLFSPLLTHAGAVPDIPVLGALPEANGGVWWLFLIIPVLGGVLAGWYASTYESGPWWLSPVIGLSISVVTGLIWMLAAWLASGPAGPGMLLRIGVDPLKFGGMIAGLTAIGAIGAMAALAWTDRGIRFKTVSVT